MPHPDEPGSNGKGTVLAEISPLPVGQQEPRLKRWADRVGWTRVLIGAGLGLLALVASLAWAARGYSSSVARQPDLAAVSQRVQALEESARGNDSAHREIAHALERLDSRLYQIALQVGVLSPPAPVPVPMPPASMPVKE